MVACAQLLRTTLLASLLAGLLGPGGLLSLVGGDLPRALAAPQ